MKKMIVPALAAATLLGAGAAHAGNVQWSIGIQLPPVATVISGGPVYLPPPVIYAPPPVVYAPAPVIYQPRPVVVRQVPRVVYADPYGGYGHPGGYGQAGGYGHYDGYGRVVYAQPHWKHDKKRHHDRGHDRRHDRRHDRDDD